MEKFYVTTPIYYVNDTPHIGHAYTTIAADVLARYKRLKGYEVFFLTGTDEHGQKVEKAALSQGIAPKELADRVVGRFKELWKRLNISNDDFIRTTEERHKIAVKNLWQEVYKNGAIYLGEYEDWYCVPCENFITEKELEDGNCPDCGREVKKLKEPSYFFGLSSYRERLLDHIDKNPDFIQPNAKRNEIKSFLREDLRNISISRTTFKWGIPVPENPEHVIYVWFDALTNYLSAIGYPDKKYKEFWPADVHIIGKDILRFHAIYWPAFLMSAVLPLPKKVFAHGWWTVEGQKMSKSLGNVIDPFKVTDKYGVDQFRYFLLREFPFGMDGDFSIGALKGRINGELANELGNLLSRTVALVVKNKRQGFPNRIDSEDKDFEKALIRPRFVDKFSWEFDSIMAQLNFHGAIGIIMDAIKNMNAYVDRRSPWAEKDPAILSNTLYTLCEGLRILAVYLFPFIPDSAQKIWTQLGIDKKIEDCKFGEEVRWGIGEFNSMKIQKGAPLFPRVEQHG